MLGISGGEAKSATFFIFIIFYAVVVPRESYLISLGVSQGRR
jgi:hypothetical protein